MKRRRKVEKGSSRRIYRARGKKGAGIPFNFDKISRNRAVSVAWISIHRLISADAPRRLRAGYELATSWPRESPFTRGTPVRETRSRGRDRAGPDRFPLAFADSRHVARSTLFILASPSFPTDASRRVRAARVAPSRGVPLAKERSAKTIARRL